MVISSVRKIVLGLEDFANVKGVISDVTSLYDAGLSSYGTVNLMLALETEFDIQVPDALLTRNTFETIKSIAGVVEALQRQPQAVDDTSQLQGAPPEASADGWFFAAESGR
jgi:acyl carrier protein